MTYKHENGNQYGDWEWRFVKTKKKPRNDKPFLNPPKEPCNLANSKFRELKNIST